MSGGVAFNDTIVSTIAKEIKKEGLKFYYMKGFLREMAVFP